MARKFSEAGAKRLLRGVAVGSAAVFCAALLAAFITERPLEKLLNGTGADVLIGILAVFMISCAAWLLSWAVRRVWHLRIAAEPGPIAVRLGIIQVSIQLAFLPAILALLIAWITAWALGSEIVDTLLQALILALVVSALLTFAGRSAINFARAFQRPHAETAADGRS